MNQNILIRAQLKAHKSANCSAQNNPPAKRSFTVFSLSEYIKAPTVTTAAIIQKVCHSMYI